MAVVVGVFIAAAAVTALMSIAAAELTPRPRLNLADLYITSSAYGDPIPIVYGDVRVAGHLIWSPGMISAKGNKKTGGKGGGGGAKNGGKKSAKGNNSAYTFTADLAFSICEGPIASVKTIWANGAIIYDATNTASTTRNAKGNPVPRRLIGTTLYDVRVYKGTPNQLPDSIIQSHTDNTNGPNSAPGYRNTAYLLFDNMNLANFGNSIPSIHAEVVTGADTIVSSQAMANLSEEAFPVTGTAGNNVLFDATGGAMYVINSTGIAVWDLTTGQEVRQALWADLWPAISDSLGEAVPLPGKWALTPQQYLMGLTTEPAHSGLSGGQYNMIALFDLNSLAFQSVGPIYADNTSATALGGARLGLAIFGCPVGDDEFGGESAFAIVLDGYTGLPTVYCAFDYLNPIQQAEEKVPVLGSFLVEDLSGTWVWTVVDSQDIVSDADLFSTADPARVMIGIPDLGEGTTRVYFMPGKVSAGNGQLGIYILTISETAAVNGNAFASVPFSELGLDSSIDYTVGDIEVDLSDGNLIINIAATSSPSSHPTSVFKWNVQSEGGVLWNVTTVAPAPAINPSDNLAPNSSGTGGGIISGRYGYYNNNAGFLLDAYNGDVLWSTTDTPATPPISSGDQATAVCGFESATQSVIVWNQTTGKFYWVQLGGVVSTNCTLQGIVSDLFARSGLHPEDYDTTQLAPISFLAAQSVSGTPFGFVVGRRTDAKTVIGQLAEVYFFDTVETGGVLTCIPRGGASTVTIPQEDLGDVKDNKGKAGDQGNYWKHTKKQELELPYEVHIKYFDQAMNFQYGDQYQRRVKTPVASMNANSIREITLPICLDATTAKQMAEKVLYTEWVERDSYAAALGWKYLYLDPADVVTVITHDSEDNITTNNLVRIIKEEVGGDLTMSTNFVAEDSDTYTSETLGDTSNGVITTYLTITTTITNVIVMDIPLIKDRDNISTTMAPLYWGCVSYSSGVWPGASIVKSEDNGQDWTADGVTTAMLFAGTASEALVPTTSPWCMNYDQSLTLYAYRGSVETLSNSTILGLDGGANMMLVGKEIIQFLNAELNGDGSWTISGLYRGLRGTDWAIGTHAVGEQCVLLESGPVSTDDYTTANVGQAWSYEAITVTSILPGPIVTVALGGAALKPYPVCHVKSQFIPTTTLDPSNLVNGVLSSTDLTVNPNHSGNAVNVAATQANSTGKWVFEVQQSGASGTHGWYGIWNNPYPANYLASGFGLVEVSQLPFPSLGIDALTSGYAQIVGNGTNADIAINGSVVLTNAASGASQTSPSLPMMVAVDLDSTPQQIWVYDPNTAMWNADPSANPDDGTGGVPLTGLTGPFVPYLGLGNVSSALLTANFGGDPVNKPFYNTQPSTFNGWCSPTVSPLGITWDRRTRFAGGLFNGTGTVPLNEAIEEYDVYFTLSLADPVKFDSAYSANYTRAFKDLTSPICLYTQAEMSTDAFNPLADTLYAVIYQVSSVVGEGFPKIVALPPIVL